VTRPKKTPPPKQERISPGVSRHSVGKGFSKRSVDTTGFPNSRKRYVTKGDYPLGFLSCAKKWAEKFLKEAGLPASRRPLVHKSLRNLLPSTLENQGSEEEKVDVHE
jgi:hypothetical protein